MKWNQSISWARKPYPYFTANKYLQRNRWVR